MALILIADDDPDIVMMLGDFLRSRGHQSVSVTNGAELVQKAKDWKPQLIVSDILMPSAYGSAAYKALSADPTTALIPVVFLTALPPAQARQVVPQSARVRLLHKPVELPRLLETIHELLSPA